MDASTQKEIEELRKELSTYKHEAISLKKAIWDMLNYTNMFVVILDNNMIVKLSNYSLATAIGFKDESEILERCWLDFVSEKDRLMIEHVHSMVKICEEQRDEKYKEVINDLVLLDGSIISVRWFNLCINHSYQMTCSVGVALEKKSEITDESIRSFYRDVIDKDRTMIQSIRDLVLCKSKKEPVCVPSSINV